MKAVELAFHEFAANYLFEECALQPFFACDGQVKAGNGSQVAEFESDGDRWVAKLYYQDSGIVHPGITNPQGTPFEMEEMREFRFSIARHSDEVRFGEQSFNAHLAPRWQGMEIENSKGERRRYSVPESITEGVNVKINGSNIDFRRYHELLCRAAEAVGITSRYFGTAPSLQQRPGCRAIRASAR